MNKLEQIKNKKLNKQLSLVTLIIAIIGLAIVPLLIRVIPVNNPLTAYNWYGGEETLFDMYAVFKSQIIITLGLLSLVVIAIRQVKFKTYDLKDPVIILISLFALITLLSHLFSIAPALSNRGMNDRYENTWVWLAYAAIFTLVYGEKWTSEQLKKIGFAFVLSNIFLSVIGFLQYLGFDPIFNDFTKLFITSFKLGSLDFSANYTINYKVIVQTLYHYNYVGFYLSLSIPVIMSLALHDKSMRHRIGYIALLALMFFNLLGSSARGGLVGVAVILPLFVLLNRHLLFSNLKILIALILVTVVVFVGFETYTDGFIVSRLMNIFTSVEAPNHLQKIAIEADTIHFNLDHGELKVNVLSKSNESWEAKYLYNDESVEIIFDEATNTFTFGNEALQGVKVFPTLYNQITLLSFELYGQQWHFAYDANQQLKFVNPFGKFDDIVTPDTFGFEGRERLGSARGYIWSRSLPLIMKRPLLGYGVDTFSVVFPQQDYVGKYNAYDTTNMIVDKPHNIYIQIALNSGLIALASYMALVILGLFRTGKATFVKKLKFQNAWTSATFLGLFSYSIAGVFNDSTVQLSSVFWILLALSLTLNKFEALKENEPKS